jgi:hypothetical protein
VITRILRPPARRSNVVVTFEPAAIRKTPSHTGQRYESGGRMTTSGPLATTYRNHARRQHVRIEESRPTFVSVSDDLKTASCSFVALRALKRGGLPCLDGSAAVLVTE